MKTTDQRPKRFEGDPFWPEPGIRRAHPDAWREAFVKALVAANYDAAQDIVKQEREHDDE